MCQLRLHLAESPLSITRCALRLLALRQIDHEGDSRISIFLEVRGANEYRHPGAIFLITNDPYSV